MFKEWWLNLTQREQRTVIIGSIIVLLALLYFLIWMPVSNGINSLQANVKEQQQLVQWMQQNVPLLQHARAVGYVGSISASSDILTVVDQSLKSANLSSMLSQIQKNEDNLIQLNFNNVSFDQLINWLITLSQHQRITVTQLTVTPINQPGKVKASLSIKFE